MKTLIEMKKVYCFNRFRFIRNGTKLGYHLYFV